MKNTQNSSNDLVTIVIPAYNCAPYLAETITSALDQSHKNIEVVVVDDGSTDDTGKVAKSFTAITYVHKPNGGVSSARNYAKPYIHGNYVFLLDSDDKLKKNSISELLRYLAKQDDTIGYVYPQLQLFGAISRITQYPAFNLDIIKFQNTVPASALIKRAVFDRFEYDTKLKVFEDWDYYLELAENGIYGSLLDKPLLLYRKHEDKTSLISGPLREKTKFAHIVRSKHRKLYSFKSVFLHNTWYMLYRFKIVDITLKSPQN